MDFASAVAIRHSFPTPFTLIFQHTFDVSPAVLGIVRELRTMVLAGLVAWSVVSIARLSVELRRGRP